MPEGPQVSDQTTTVRGGLIGVGVGPGDPELLTMRAVRVIRAADRVLAPSSAIDAVGRAESIVRQACPGVPIERLVFAMGDAAPSIEAAAATIVAHLDAGDRVVFVTLGDPNVYSTFSSVAAIVTELRPGAAIETVPGIMAFQELASRSGTVVLQNTERLALITALDGPDSLGDALDDPTQAVVVYKGGRHLPEMAKRLASTGRLDGAVVGELLGLPGERVLPVAAAVEGPAAYLATLIVPPAGRALELRKAENGLPDRQAGERSELDLSEPEISRPSAGVAVQRTEGL
ncbi:MAG: Cobalt-precorrin-2 C(20)-methyltransferase [uncultured Acidimicrobiales bacterium]|uniref:Cobalt-precorrin-2 C(20)-methyltransferase n=1 Tax=uncultured Acidimicrobiales bacterium TaxID=310071 RepID=A0A6J4HG56_9ACTN|nr:MAG: Cobalt-precorrin-2 C(20)-methyltransferase [uncultured Acidimicrobiales bacterium]